MCVWLCMYVVVCVCGGGVSTVAIVFLILLLVNHICIGFHVNPWSLGSY